MNRLITAALLLFACFFCPKSYGQDNIPEFGKVDIADLQMKECPFAKNADGMYLFNWEHAKIIFNYGFFMEVERRIRLKIFTQNGLDYAKAIIPYFSKHRISRITDISAITYSLDEAGNVVTTKLERKDIFREKTDKNESTVRFAFPNAKPGSIIEVRFVERDRNSLDLDPWIFQQELPVRSSVCQLEYDQNVHIHMRVVSQTPPEEHTDTSRGSMLTYNISHTYSLQNIAAFKHEPLMSSVSDNLQRIEFSASPMRYAFVSANETWALLNQSLLNLDGFGGQFDKKIPGTDSKIDSIKSLLTPDEKIDAVYRWVKNTVIWDEDQDIQTENIADAWAAGKGSNVEINLILLNLLRKVGIKCYPLLVRSKDAGKIDMNFPNSGQFNGADLVIQEGGKNYILDGSQKYQSYQIPPYNVLNTYALIIDKKECSWVAIKDNRELMKNVISISAAVDSSGTISGKVVEYFYDYAKVDFLSSTEKNTNNKDLLEKNITDIKIDSLKEQGADQDSEPYVRSFQFKLDLEQTGNYYFLDPFFLSSFKKNPFTDSLRNTDIDFGCNQYYSVNMFVKLPDNIKLSDAPPNKEIRLADSSFSFGRFTAMQNNNVVIRNHFELQSDVFPAKQYSFVKDAFGKMYAMMNEKIVFKKE